VPKQNTRSAPDGATPTDSLSAALSAALAEEFEEFAASPFVRKAVRASIAGKVKRRSLLELGFAQGCRTGHTAGTIACRLARSPAAPSSRLRLD